MSESVIDAVTGLGDAVYLLLGSAALLVLLFRQAGSWLALSWLAALMTCVFVTLVTKLIFMGFTMSDPEFAKLRLFSPSGHASFSLTFYVCLALLTFETRRRARLAMCLGAVLLAIAIGGTRIMRDDHSLGEVVLGFTIGAMSVGLFLLLRAKRPELSVRRGSLAGLTVFLAAAAYLLSGNHLSAEKLLVSAAAEIWKALRS